MRRNHPRSAPLLVIVHTTFVCSGKHVLRMHISENIHVTNTNEYDVVVVFISDRQRVRSSNVSLRTSDRTAARVVTRVHSVGKSTFPVSAFYFCVRFGEQTRQLSGAEKKKPTSSSFGSTTIEFTIIGKTNCES